MEQAQSLMGVATAAAPQSCPLCGARVTPDALGFVECVCGWGGPGDPLESARGLSRFVTRLDRRLANAMARRDLARLARHGGDLGALNPLYLLTLLIASTLIYALIGALLIGCVALGVFSALDGAWLGVGVAALFVALLSLPLFERRSRWRGVEATRERFPALWLALAEVAQRVGAPVPDRVALLPGANFFASEAYPLRRCFRRELVVEIGVAALALQSEADLKAILAHELAHYSHGHTLVARYVGRAEDALRGILRAALDAVRVQSRGHQRAQRRIRGGSSLTGFTLLASGVIWLLTLPLRLALVGFHLLRLAQSRSAEFEADHAAARSYGAQAFADGLSAVTMTMRTLQGTQESLRMEMQKHNNPNFYAELRRHYAELPPAIITKLRVESVQEYRSLEDTHPSTPDRLRALAAGNLAMLAPQPPRPAGALLIPAGESSAEGVERELTTRLFR